MWAEKVVELAGVLLLQESLYQCSRLSEFTGQKIGLGKVVAVVVGAGVDFCAFSSNGRASGIFSDSI